MFHGYFSAIDIALCSSLSFYMHFSCPLRQNTPARNVIKWLAEKLVAKIPIAHSPDHAIV